MATYLKPSTGPIYDAELEDVFQALVVGLTGLPGNMVRPRWQRDPPNAPSVSTDWAAIGLVLGAKQWDDYQLWDQALPGYVVEGSEELRLTASFYGPSGERLLRQFDNGLQVDFNRHTLDLLKIKYKGATAPVHLPALLKEQWGQRVDAIYTFSRWCRRVYPVGYIERANISIDNERFVEYITLVPPSP